MENNNKYMYQQTKGGLLCVTFVAASLFSCLGANFAISRVIVGSFCSLVLSMMNAKNSFVNYTMYFFRNMHIYILFLFKSSL